MVGKAANKTAFVIGADGSIGSNMTSALARKGYDVVACAVAPNEEFEHALGKIAASTGSVVSPCYFDATDDAALEGELARAARVFGVPDALVNCAGILRTGLALGMPMSDIRESFEVNLFSHINAIRVLASEMIRRRSGAIVEIASTSGLCARKGDIAYGSSKAALCVAVAVLAQELGPFGLRVNAIAPGVVGGGMESLIADKERRALLSSCPLGRFASVQEVASLACFLLSDEASYINGETIRLDGGAR